MSGAVEGCTALMLDGYACYRRRSDSEAVSRQTRTMSSDVVGVDRLGRSTGVSTNRKGMMRCECSNGWYAI
jgi:hypothetical protein